MTTIIKNTSIIPMNAETVLNGMDVLIKGNRITRIGANLDSNGAQIVDGSGKYLLPGLWDMHAHTFNSKCLNLFLANGVTSVRNLWGLPEILRMRDEITAGTRVGPTIHSTSPLMDGVNLMNGCTIVSTPEEAYAALAQAQQDGYTEIKTYPSIPREAYFALMQRAKELGLKVVGHANTSVAPEELIESGYHSIEHASILFTASGGAHSGQWEENVIKLARSGMWLVPTLVVVWMIIGCGFEDLDPTTMTHNEYADEVEKGFWRAMVPMVSELAQRRGLNKPEIARLTRVFYDHSDNMLLGTDQANPGIIAGFSLHDELALNVSELGLTPYQALRLGTVNAARYYDLDGELGTVEEAKQADLLLVDANPLEDVRNTQHIAAVFKNGVLYNRPALDALLEESKKMPYEDA